MTIFIMIGSLVVLILVAINAAAFRRSYADRRSGFSRLEKY